MSEALRKIEETAPVTQETDLIKLRPEDVSLIIGPLIDKFNQVIAKRTESPEEIQFGLVQRQAKALSESTLIPKDFQGKVSNCMIALDIANRMNAPPLLVMQNMYIVHGKPSWSSQFLIATFNQCGRFSPIRYEFFGIQGKDDWGCKAYAIELSTGEILYGPAVTLAMAKAEGWVDKAGSKWKTMPEMMLRYRSAAFFVRTVAPELSMGLPMQDEIEDIQPQSKPALTLDVVANSLES